MAANFYELFQLKPVGEIADLRGRPYRYLREHALEVTIDNYDSVLRGDIMPDENLKQLRSRLEVELSGDSSPERETADGISDSTSLCINVSDVLAVTKEGLTEAYYVDPTRLILIPDFFHSPTDGSLITIDTENRPLDGRKGSWMTVDSLMVDGRLYYLMQSQDYGRDAPYVVVDDKGKEFAADKNGFTEETIEQIRQSLKELEERQVAEVSQAQGKKPRLEIWQQYFENGEYLRAAEISEEQNYNMIDGTMNNRSTRRSVLERLQEKQSEMKTGQTHVPEISSGKEENDLARSRK